jgi:ABC-type Fe3+-hydroxamate transport system substrate-binding protein
VYITVMNTKSIKFLELANKRVNKTIKDIQLIGNLANKQNYDYTEQQAKQIIKALQQELDEVKQSFINTNTSTKKTFALDDPE